MYTGKWITDRRNDICLRKRGGFWDRLTFITRFLKDKKSMCFEVCPYCDSTDIVREDKEEQVYETSNVLYVYTAKYTCANCGGSGRVREKWTKAGGNDMF